MESTTTRLRTVVSKPVQPDFQSYIARRRDFHRRLGGAWSATVSDPFDILDPFPMSRSELSNICDTASAIAGIYKSFLGRLRQACDDTLRELGIPAPLNALLRTTPHQNDFPFLARLDLACSATGHKMLEINSEAPGFLVEAFPVCTAANEHIGGANPNAADEKRLRQSVRQLTGRAAIRMGRSLESVRVAFSAHDPFARDREGALYLMSLLDGVATAYVPFEQLRADRNGLYDATGSRIDILFRMFSLRAFATGASQFSPSVSAASLARLIDDDRLTLVNAPLGLLAECKSVQAAIWGLRSNRDFFTPDQQRTIESVMLPTFLDLPDDMDRYVVKPKLGFNSDTIKVVDRRTATTLASGAQTFAGEDMVYQQYVELPMINVMTEYGATDLSFLASCFLVDGEPCGVIFRAGTGITNYDWWLVPVTERRDPA
jgi:glutathionylspermidine synthase